MQTYTQYQVAIKYKNGSLGYLSCHNRTQWAIRTARKHAKELTESMVKGVYGTIAYVAVIAS